MDAGHSKTRTKRTTIAGNTVGQAAIETLGSASGTVNNAALYDNSAAGGDFTKGTSTVSVGNSCSQENLTAFGAGNATLVLSPFSATFASQHVYLQPLAGDPSCINRGDDAVATAAGSAWSMLSAYANGSLDLDSGDGLTIGNDVDAGRHYHPLAVRIPTMAATISDVSWTTDNASTCRLLDSATNAMTSLLSATLPSGTLSHGQTSGAQLVLICFGVNGEPAIARATVP